MLSSQKEVRQLVTEVQQEVVALTQTERMLLRWYRQCSPEDRAYVVRFVSALAETGQKH